MRRPPRITKNLPQHVHKKREGMDAKHITLLHELPCLACGREPHGSVRIEAHHLITGGVARGERGTSLKAPDRCAVPLCMLCHQPGETGSAHHAGQDESWFAERGIDARAVADALWRARGDVVAMWRIIARARQDAGLKRAG